MKRNDNMKKLGLLVLSLIVFTIFGCTGVNKELNVYSGNLMVTRPHVDVYGVDSRLSNCKSNTEKCRLTIYVYMTIHNPLHKPVKGRITCSLRNTESTSWSTSSYIKKSNIVKYKSYSSTKFILTKSIVVPTKSIYYIGASCRFIRSST